MITVLIILAVLITVVVEDERKGSRDAEFTATTRHRRAWNHERLDLNPAFRRSRK